MKILGIQCYQDYNVTYYNTDTKELKYIELEKLLKKKHFSFHSDIIDYMPEIDRIYNDKLRNNLYKCQKIIKEQFGVDHFDVVCWNYKTFKDGYLKKESYDFVKMLERCDVIKFHHQENHVLPAIIENDLEDALCLSIDGKGDGNHAFYHWQNNKLTKLYQEQKFSYGMYYEVLSCYFLDKRHKYEQGLEGKFMAYAGLSNNFIQIKNIDDFEKAIKDVNWNIWEDKEAIETYIYNFLDEQSKEFDKYDLAYTMQKLWIDWIMRELAQYRHESDNLVFSGGCAMNCMLNYMIEKTNWFNHVYYTPIVADTGQSYGAVLNYLLHYKPDELKYISSNSYSCTNNMEEKEIFERKQNKFKTLDIDELVDKLNDDKIVGVCRGNIEMGARALGRRSILASPFHKEMHDRLNTIKGREWYRPYGIIVPDDKISEYFDINIQVPYMNILAKPKFDNLLGAMHKDGTIRIQTVSEKDDKWLYNLLIKFGEKTGIPILINTSFNDSGLPIFNYFSDMYRMYQEKLDGLIIENSVIYKE